MALLIIIRYGCVTVHNEWHNCHENTSPGRLSHSTAELVPFVNRIYAKHIMTVRTTVAATAVESQLTKHRLLWHDTRRKGYVGWSGGGSRKNVWKTCTHREADESIYLSPHSNLRGYSCPLYCIPLQPNRTRNAFSCLWLLWWLDWMGWEMEKESHFSGILLRVVISMGFWAVNQNPGIQFSSIEEDI